MTRQSASVAPLRLARQGCHAGWRDKANVLARASPFSLNLPFFPSLFPDQNCSQGDAGGRHPPRSPPNSDFLRGKSAGNRSPSLSEGIAPNISSFNRVH